MNFSDFFKALWSTPEKQRAPFPWQEMLANEPAWPAAIDLPTASGKTACIDAAIYRLATGAPCTGGQPMPRRLWFVVDRRIVVDEAFQRALAIAQKLQSAKTGPLRDMADKLKALSGTGTPLAVARLRGGTWRDDKGWASDPRQPAIICTTVDQIGSSLLFRAYGHGDLTASVYAGLAGNDSLIILDEAHCSEPFRQTLSAISTFRQKPWSVDTPPVPFAFTIMSATLGEDLQKKAFPAPEQRADALNHPALDQRSRAVKQATLRTVKNDSEFHEKARSLANEAVAQGGKRIAIMVNRVATAQEIFKKLSEKESTAYTPILITGRMRPMDRDKLIVQWSPVLASDPTQEPDRPVIVVTTQCLEVGADFSFDALITECASLDALRQRFGRLDRLGNFGHTEASILIRAEHTKEPDDKDADPIYGKAIYHTWTWLNEIGTKVEGTIVAKKRAKKKGTEVASDQSTPETHTLCRVDFGIAALSQALATLADSDDQAEPEERRLTKMLAPQPDAPILLPGHLDLLCQTGPRPAVEPEISLFLHGKGRTSAEVRVIFRCDCPEDGKTESLNEYLPTLALLPPTSPEALSVPLHRIRHWLIDEKSTDFTGDVEGEATETEDTKQPFCRTRPFIRWRGKKKSRICHRDIDLHNGDTIVLPARRDIFDALGQVPDHSDDTGKDRLDLAERATFQAKGQVVLRLNPAVWEPWKELHAVKALLDCAYNDEADRDDFKNALSHLFEVECTKCQQASCSTSESDPATQEPSLPAWLLVLLRRLRRHPFQVQRSAQTVMLLCYRRFRGKSSVEADPFDEDDADERSRTRNHQGEVTLTDHTAQVQRLANAFALHRWPAIADEISRASFCHDLGKLDPRFQIMLRGGSYLAFGHVSPIAKSATLPTRQQERTEIETLHHLPPGFRHEMLSAQIAQQLYLAQSPLALHLITSHHGYSRPFAPIITDEAESQQASGSLQTDSLSLPEITAKVRSGFEPPHKLSEDHANRFWLLTRRYGWWGLAYAEMLLRLADWEASAKPETNLSPPSPPTPLPPESAIKRTTLDLPGIDGSNPLGALAALGVLRSLTQAWPTRDVRLHWRILKGGWKAVISYNEDSSVQISQSEVVEAIASVLKLGFKAQTEGWENRDQAQRDLEAIKVQIEQIKASIKQRKLKGEAKKAAEEAEIEPLKAQQTVLEQAIIDPTDLAKKAFDTKKKEVKDAVNALKKRKLKGAEQKNARAKLIEPLEIELEKLRQAWLVLLRTAVPFREMALGKRVDVPVDEYRGLAEQLVAAAEKWPAEMLCHFGSDGRTDRGTTEPTPLSFINGSGHQFFLETALELTKCITNQKLHNALFAAWVPEDEKFSMRWLPSEDRRYALMANNPSGGEKTLTVWAANLLGYIGLGLLPSAPGKHSLKTVGIIQSKEPIFRWPIWQEPLTAAATASLLAQSSDTSPVTTHRQSTRIEVGDGANKKINFTPSVAV
jgi:CRISPR-associated endonuclease/helicase Cas3